MTFVRTVASKRVILNFANTFGLVYFGNVSQHNDDHQLVRGITLSHDHKDRHYSVGAIQEYDAILLQRTDVLHFPGRQSKNYTWIILQLDLHVIKDPKRHIFIDAHHEDIFYANMIIKHAHLRQIKLDHFVGHDSRFINHYRIFASPEESTNLSHLLTPDITATIGHHFSQFDFEITGDKLLIYASNVIVSKHSLNEMARAGLWLAKHLDAQV